MPRNIKKQSKMAGLPPGTLIHIGEKNPGKTKITLLTYDQDHYEKKILNTIQECFIYKDTPQIKWINIDGLQDVGLIQQLDEHFGIHPLVLEDILNTGQRPKIENFENYLFIVLKMIYLSPQGNDIVSEQVSLIVGQNICISFQEKEGDVFDPVRKRLEENKGRIRKLGVDYLAYALLDAIVDNYYVVLEKFAEDMEILDETLMNGSEITTARKIHKLKRVMIDLRKQIWPLREIIGSLQRGESKLIKKTTVLYLRDIYDHIIQVMDNIDTSRDMLSGMHDVYLSSISNKMNEIMKTLTIFAAIFIPLTFVAGIYGMNFEFMPELKWRWGYLAVLGLMSGIGVGLIVYFKKKKWF